MAENSMYHTHISAKHRWLDLNLKEVWQYRDLIYLFTKRNFVVSYKQTIIGPAWIFLTPLFTSIVQAFVFGGIAGIGTDGIPTFLFYLCSNAVWAYFANCLTSNANTFTANAYVFGKVYFPRLCAPISTILVTMLNFFIQFTFFLIFLTIYALKPNPVVHVNWALASMFPLVLLQMGLLGLGVGISVSALTVRYRDLALLVSFGVSLWMYISPVAYPTSLMIQNFPGLKTVFMLNPMTPIIEYFRAAFLGTTTFNAWYLLLSAGVTLLFLFLGTIFFNRVEKTFMDTI